MPSEAKNCSSQRRVELGFSIAFQLVGRGIRSAEPLDLLAAEAFQANRAATDGFLVPAPTIY
jgi:hypothetical protein